MALPKDNIGGNNSAPNRAPAQRVIASALANARVANALIAALGGVATFSIVAAHTSATTDFGILLPGDLLIHIPAVAGNAGFEVVVTAGTKPSAAVVGDLYLALRTVNLDANNPATIPNYNAGQAQAGEF